MCHKAVQIEERIPNPSRSGYRIFLKESGRPIALKAKPNFICINVALQMLYTAAMALNRHIA